MLLARRKPTKLQKQCMMKQQILATCEGVEEAHCRNCRNGNVQQVLLAGMDAVDAGVELEGELPATKRRDQNALADQLLIPITDKLAA